jgi:hypothetical protein
LTLFKSNLPSSQQISFLQLIKLYITTKSKSPFSTAVDAYPKNFI